MLNLFNKKGVSPIIAAVLLVVITIAIGATTMAFIRSLTDSNLESAKIQSAKLICGNEVQIEIPIVNDQYQICYYNSTGALKFLAHNIGTRDIKGFSMTVILANGTVTTTDFTDPTTYAVAKNVYKQVNLTPSPSVNYAVSNVTQWRVEPKIQGDPGKDLTICSDSPILRDSNEVAVCT